jgi:hypothetical protein
LQLAASVGELLFQGRIREPVDRGARDEDQVGAGRNETLVRAKHGAEAALGAVALDGGTDLGDGGDDADARQSGGSGRGFAPEKPNGKGTAVDATALFARGAKITRAPQMLLRAETHGEGKRLKGRKTED